MFFSNYCNKLYLSNYNYNFAKVLAELKTIVENNGGTVKEQQRGVAINRYYIDKMNELQESIERLTNALKTKDTTHKETYTKVIDGYKKELAELEKTPVEEFETDNLTYIQFCLNGVYYYFQSEENGFFPWYYRKTPIVNGQASQDACGEEFPRDSWIIDTLYNVDCNNAEQREIANIIFNTLVTANNSVKRIGSHRVRVSNLYNNGYHYETIRDKERFAKVDF